MTDRKKVIHYIRMLMYWKDWEEHVPFLLSRTRDVEFDTWGHGDEKGVVVRIKICERTQKTRLLETLRYGRSFSDQEIIQMMMNHLSVLSEECGNPTRWWYRIGNTASITGEPTVSQQHELDKMIYGGPVPGDPVIFTKTDPNLEVVDEDPGSAL